MTSIPSPYSSGPRTQGWRQSIGSPRAHRYAEASSSIPEHIPSYDSTVYRDDKYSPASQLKPAKDGSWRRDSPMEYRDEPESWTSRTDSGTTLPSRALPTSYEKEDDDRNNWELPYDTSRSPTVQATPAWATSGNAPSPRRIMNFSRPMRNGETSESNRSGYTSRDATRPVATNPTDEDLERRLRALDMRSRPRPRDTESTQHPQPQPSVYSPRGKGRQSGRAYSRPTLSPIPSMASATTLSTLRRHREEEEAEEHEAENETHTKYDEDALPADYMQDAERRSLSASSSTTSFASQLAPVPLSHYPAASPLAETAPSQSMPSSELFPTYPQYPSTRARPPLGRPHQAEPSTSSTSTSNTSNTNPNTVYMNNGRSSSSNPPSSHTSATTSSQPSMDVDRIGPVSAPMPSPASMTKSNLSLNLNQTSSANSNPGSQGRVRPMRTHSTTSSGATSAMEAFKASNYDISTLTDSQIAKLKKKGIDPQLYMEMKAATGGMSKDGKKRSKWSRALVGNTFIG